MIKKASILLLVIIIMGIGITACGASESENNKETQAETVEKAVWPKGDLGKLIPEPESNKRTIKNESSKAFSVTVEEIDAAAFDKYVDACWDAGFQENYSKSEGVFSAEDGKGHILSLRNRNGEMTINLSEKKEEPAEAQETEESNASTAIAEDNATPEPNQREQANDYNEVTNKEYRTDNYIIPIPAAWIESSEKSGFYTEQNSDAGFLSAYEKEGVITSKEQFEIAVKDYLSKRADVLEDSNITDLKFYNHDTTGLPCGLAFVTGKREGHTVVSFAFFLIDDGKILVVDYLETDVAERSHLEDAIKVIANIRQIENSATTSDGSIEEQSQIDNGNIRPEIKEAIDSYEAFMNEYASFMESYDASNTSMLTEYLALMSKYAEVTESMEALEDADLSEAEEQYYTEVSLRVSQRLLEASQNME